MTSVTFTLRDKEKSDKKPVRLEEIVATIDDPATFIRSLEPEDQDEFVRAIVTVAADNFIDALQDYNLPEIKGAPQLIERGTILMDVFVARAEKLGRMPDEYESAWVTKFRTEAAHLQRLIGERDIDGALAQLAEMVPGDTLLQPATAKMVGSFVQDRLL